MGFTPIGVIWWGEGKCHPVLFYLNFLGGFWVKDGHWLIDLRWVQALTVPMHLGLINGPFVPHNPISALSLYQSSRWPPRLKIWMSSGPQKGTQIYYPFLSKSLGKRILYRFPNRAPIERDPRLQGIFTYLLIYLFISKALRKERPPTFPKSGPLWKQTPIPEPYSTYLSGSSLLFQLMHFTAL